MFLDCGVSDAPIHGFPTCNDLVFYHNTIFMYDFHNDSLPETFNTFFFPVNQRRNYNTRLASRSSHSLPHIRTNYGKFNIRYSGVKVWNEIDDETKKLKPACFIKKLKKYLLEKYLE
jgi:hypothetical protein